MSAPFFGAAIMHTEDSTMRLVKRRYDCRSTVHEQRLALVAFILGWRPRRLQTAATSKSPPVGLRELWSWQSVPHPKRLTSASRCDVGPGASSSYSHRQRAPGRSIHVRHCSRSVTTGVHTAIPANIILSRSIKMSTSTPDTTTAGQVYAHKVISTTIRTRSLTRSYTAPRLRRPSTSSSSASSPS
jgi:hypothetical protein